MSFTTTQDSSHCEHPLHIAAKLLSLFTMKRATQLTQCIWVSSFHVAELLLNSATNKWTLQTTQYQVQVEELEWPLVGMLKLNTCIPRKKIHASQLQLHHRVKKRTLNIVRYKGSYLYMYMNVYIYIYILENHYYPKIICNMFRQTYQHRLYLKFKRQNRWRPGHIWNNYLWYLLKIVYNMYICIYIYINILFRKNVSIYIYMYIYI